MNHITTDTIRLVGATPELYDVYYKFRSDKGDIFWTGYLAPPDYEKMKTVFLNRCSDLALEKTGGERIWIVQKEKDGVQENAGYIMLRNKEDGFEYSHSILEAYRGQGIATRAAAIGKEIAFQYTNLVYAYVRDDNIASQKVFIKNGYRKTDSIIEVPSPAFGVLRQRRWECYK